MEKTIITAVGKDKVGIIARLCTFLAENNVNILDISQTITQDYFHMMMITDFSKAKPDFFTMKKKLEELGEEIGIKIQMQKEEIFDCMHRI